jgi:hypothetical protein
MLSNIMDMHHILYTFLELDHQKNPAKPFAGSATGVARNFQGLWPISVPRFSTDRLSQPYAWTTAVLVDELDAGGFQGATDR